MRLKRFAIGALVLGMALSACGGDDPDPGASTAAPDEAASEAAPKSAEPSESVEASGDTSAAGEPVMGGVARIDWIADPPALDPLRFNSMGTFFTYTLVYDTVVAWEDGELVPQLASEMPTVSDDGLTYEIPIREGVKFHDGTDLTAEDVVHSFDVIRDPVNNSGWNVVLASAESVEAVDNTVILKLSSPYAPLLGMMSRLYIISAEDEYVVNETLANTMNGTGPFKFVSWDQGSQITLERNDDYYVEGRPYLDGVEIVILPDDTARLANISNGTSHIMPKVPYDQIELLRGRGNDLTVNVPDKSILMPTIWPSLQEGRPTADVAVRRAIAQAVDRGQIIDQLYGGYAVEASTFMASGMEFWNEDLGTAFGRTADLESAQQSLDDADIAIDRPLVLIHRAEPIETAIATVVQSNLSALGVEVELSSEEAASYLPKLIAGDYDLMLLSLEGGTTGANTMHTEYSAIYSESPANYQGFNDPEMDRLLDIAIGTPEDPAAAWRDVQEADLAMLPYIPLVTARYAEGVSTGLAGYDTSELITLRGLEHAWLTE